MTASFDAWIASNGASSGVDYRLVIEGCPYQFCTGGLTFGTLATGVERVPGLQRDGLGFDQTVYLAGAELDASIGAAKIDEGAHFPTYRGRATRAFSRIADVVGYLTATLTAGSTSATVNDSSLFADGYYHLGTETIQVTARPTGTTLTIVRGRWGTTAQEHPVLSPDERANIQPLYDWPSGYRKRRAWLYAHMVDELGTASDGTVVWRGIVAKEPAVLNTDGAMMWSIAFDSRLGLLDASIAGGWDGGFKLRGIYYPGGLPLTVVLERQSGTTFFGSTVDGTTTIRLAGFWETQDEFAAALTAAIEADATVASWGVNFSVRVDARGGWQIWYETATASPRFVRIQASSFVDGMTTGGLISEAESAAVGDGEEVFASAPYLRTTVVASTWYRAVWDRAYAPLGIAYEDQRILPRSNNFTGFDTYVGHDPADAVTYPLSRIYLNRVASLVANVDSFSVVPQVTSRGAPYNDSTRDSRGDLITPESQTQRCTITAVGASSYLELDDGGRGPRIVAAGGHQPTFDASIVMLPDGRLDQMLDELVARAPSTANRGQSPWLTSDDVDAWETSVVDAAAGRAALLHRSYVFAKSTKAIEVLREEWKLYRLIPYFTATGLLAVRPLAVGDGAPVASIGADNHLIDDGAGGVDGEADGLCTVVELMLGFDPVEGENNGPTYRFRNLSAIARVKDEVVLTIEPKSAAVGVEVDAADINAIGLPITTLFGARRTSVVTVKVSLSLWGVLLGDQVTVTVHELPADGDRAAWTAGAGMTDRAGIVIGRSWDLATGVGELRVLLHELGLAGYSPSGRIASQSGATTSWVLTLDHAFFSTTGDAAFFRIGDAIRIYEFDAGAPQVRLGTVTAQSGDTVSVTLTSSWTPGASEWRLMYDQSDSTALADAQLEYAYVANASRRIELNGDTTLPNEFSI